MPVVLVGFPVGKIFDEEIRLFGVQMQRRKRLFQKLLFGTLLRFQEETDSLLIGTEKCKIHRFIVRRSAHPLC